MSFVLEDQQRLLVRTIRDFVKRELMPLEDTVEAQGFLADDIATEIQQKSRDLGLYAVNIPTEYGGGGLSVFDLMLAE